MKLRTYSRLMQDQAKKTGFTFTTLQGWNSFQLFHLGRVTRKINNAYEMNSA